MHIRSKFDGGKQINRSQAGGWTGRCAGAGLRQNLDGNWSPQVWAKVFGTQPNQIFDEILTNRAKQVSKDRKRKSSESAKLSRSKSKRRKTNDNSVSAQKDYHHHGNDQIVQDVANQLPQSFLEDKMLRYYRVYVKVSKEKMEEIDHRPK